MSKQVTLAERKRIRSLFAREGNMQMYKNWKENEDLVCEKFPELIKAIAECDDSFSKLRSAVKELKDATASS